MGVRISWLTLARNSSLARLAASAASLARAQLFLGPFSFSHIADEGDEQVVLAHSDGGDADLGGELAAIAAQGPDLD